MIGCMTEMKIMSDWEMMEYFITFYRIQAADVTQRVPIGSIKLETNSLPYYHSFGHTADYLLMGHNSVSIDVPGITAGKSMIDNMKIDYSKNLEFWVMNIADGTYKKYETDHGGFMMHAGNTYVDDDGNLIHDSEMFIDSDSSPFSIAHLEYLRNADREALNLGSILRRYKINLESGEVTHEDIITQE
jgi:carotenoid cleavage dioxygenase-like enzyme